MLKALYHWTMGKLAGPHGEKWLAGLSFAEASFFPIPPDVLLLPMILAKRARAFRLATITTVASIIGALAGYAIGALLYETVAKPIIGFYGYETQFATFTDYYTAYGVLIVIAGGLTPIPFKVITIASGVAGLNPLFFALSTIPARAPRFYIEAWLLWRFGPPIKSFIEKRLTLVITSVIIVGILGFVVLKYV